jgi:predicted MFS family arabinose efflux permease
MFASLVAGVTMGIAPVLNWDLTAEATTSEERGLGMALDLWAVNTGKAASGLAFGGFAQSHGVGQAILVGNALVLSGTAFAVSLYRKSLRRQPP